jgi:DNA repair ATPase RecN
MRTDIYPDIIRASALRGGLSAHELTMARELHPSLSHIFDLLEDVQEQLEEAEEKLTRELREQEEDYELKLRSIADILDDIEMKSGDIRDMSEELDGISAEVDRELRRITSDANEIVTLAKVANEETQI